MANPTKISQPALKELVASRAFPTEGEAIEWAAEQRAAGFATKRTYGFNGRGPKGRKLYIHRVFVYRKD